MKRGKLIAVIFAAAFAFAFLLPATLSSIALPAHADDGPVVYTVTNDAELRSYQDNTNDKIINIAADAITVTSYIRQNYNTVMQPAPGRERVTLNWAANHADYTLYIGDNAQVVFRNIDFVATEQARAGVINNINAGGSLTFENCTFTYGAAAGKTPTRLFSGANAANVIVMSDSTFVIPAATMAMYRGQFYFAGNASIKDPTDAANETKGSSATIYDFRDITVAETTEAGSTGISCTGTVSIGGADIAAGDIKLYYTLDGSDPKVDGLLYTAPFTTPAEPNVPLKVAVTAAVSETAYFCPKVFELLLNEMAVAPDVTVGDMVIDYAAETLSFDAAIEVNSAADFSGSAFTSGSAVAPGATWYARYKETEIPAGAVYTFNVPTRPETPQAEVISATVDTITLTEIAGAEYKLNPDGEWLTDNVFTELVKETTYSFSVRRAATTIAFASLPATVSGATTATFGPVAAADYEIDFAAQSLIFGTNIEGNLRNDFAGDAVVSGGTVTPGTSVYLRYKGIVGVDPGPATEVELPAAPAFPQEVSVFAVNNAVITLNAVLGAEYKLGNGEWQTTTTFSGLTQETDYEISMRLRGTAEAFPSVVATKTVKTTADEWANIEVDTFELYSSALSNQAFAFKNIVLTADVEGGTSAVNVYGTVKLTSFGSERKTVTYKGTSNMLYLRDKVTMTIENVHLNYDSTANYGVVYFYTGTQKLTVIDSKISATRRAYRTFHPAGSGNDTYLYNVEIDDDATGVTFYRGNYYLYGTTSYKGGDGSANVFNYCGVTLSAEMDAAFNVTLKYNKLPVFRGSVNTDNVKLYYTVDGSDPMLGGALEYTAPIKITGLTYFRYCLADFTSTIHSASEKVEEVYFFAYTVDYKARTLGFDAATIDISRSSDFDVLLSSGAPISDSESLFCRIAATPTEKFTITMPAAPAAPAGMTVTEKTDTQISLFADSTVEYKLGVDGKWGANVFTGLTAKTDYTVYFRYKATATAFYSQEGSLAVKTLGKKAAVTGADYTVDYANAKITYVTGIQVNTAKSFADTTALVSGAPIQPGMTLYIRVAADAENVAGDTVTLVLPARPTSPGEITFTAEKNKITVAAVDGAEYMLVSGEDSEWQDSPVFEGLSKETEYTIRVRIKATGTAFESAYTEITATTAGDKESGCKSSGSGALSLGAVMILLAGAALLFVGKKNRTSLKK